MIKMTAQHISDGQIEQYLKFLNKEEPEQLNPQDITEIEEHLADCEKCGEKMAKAYEIQEYVAKWDFNKFKKTVEQANILRILQTQKEKNTNKETQTLIDKLITNVSKINQNTLEIYMKAKQKGKRLLSQIAFDPAASPFQYALSTEGARGEEGAKPVKNMTSVMTSGKIKDAIKVDLDEANKQLTITIKATDKKQNLILLNIGSKDAHQQLISQAGTYDEQTQTHTFIFKDLEQGKYFLFFEPETVG